MSETAHLRPDGLTNRVQHPDWTDGSSSCGDECRMSSDHTSALDAGIEPACDAISPDSTWSPSARARPPSSSFCPPTPSVGTLTAGAEPRILPPAAAPVEAKPLAPEATGPALWAMRLVATAKMPILAIDDPIVALEDAIPRVATTSESQERSAPHAKKPAPRMDDRPHSSSDRP